MLLLRFSIKIRQALWVYCISSSFQFPYCIYVASTWLSTETETKHGSTNVFISNKMLLENNQLQHKYGIRILCDRISQACIACNLFTCFKPARIWYLLVHFFASKQTEST